MTNSNPVEFRTKLEDFSYRLQARIAEFKGQGEFSPVRRATVSQSQQRRDRVGEAFAQAKRTGSVWEMAKAALARDINSLSEDLLRLEERLDAETMKRRPE